MRRRKAERETERDKQTETESGINATNTAELSQSKPNMSAPIHEAKNKEKGAAGGGGEARWGGGGKCLK